MILSRRCRPQLAIAATLLTALALGGCGYSPERSLSASTTDQQTAVANIKGAKAKTKSRAGKAEAGVKYSQERQVAVSKDERECLVRAMYFESQRASREGLIAVGTVVMNRVNSPSFPGTICGVVGQRRQFASGVLSRQMSPRDRVHAETAADEVMAGKRHAGIGDAMFFHVASRRYKYPNMRYLQVAGGNIFYTKVGRNAPRVVNGSALAYANNAAVANEPKSTIVDAKQEAPIAAEVIQTTRDSTGSSTPVSMKPLDAAQEDPVSAAVTASVMPPPRISLRAPVDEALMRAQSFSKKPLVLESFRTAKTSR